MQNYEIRIKDSKGLIICLGPQLNDRSALRQALELARAKDFVEVWRGDTCLYSRPSLPSKSWSNAA
ncbi:MAG TPA: hypothetical protein VFI23_13760 [Rhizomicrobium sp.]|nr:hypothetical protein [Rhizomicrobium sp.]